MPEYKCLKCGSDFKKKWSYEYHINRKNPCVGNKNDEIEKIENHEMENNKKNINLDENELNCEFCKKSYSNISNLNKHIKVCKVKINKEREEELEKIRSENEKKENIKNEQNKINKPITIHISKINANQNILNNIIKKEEDKINLEKFKTFEENVKFSNKDLKIDNLEKENYEKINNDSKNSENKNKNIIREEYESEFIKEIRKELSELRDYIKNNQNVNNNAVNNHYTFLTQINQNFFIHNFGKECMDSIQTDFYFNLLSSPYDSVPKLVEEIHFNKQNPYNTNIILPNQNLPFIYVYENGKWIIANKESTLNQLVDKNFERVDDFYDHYKNYLEKTIIENYEKYSNEFVESNLKEDIQKDVSNVLERGSQQIIETIIEKRKKPLIQDNNINNKNSINNLNNVNNVNNNNLLNLTDVKVLNEVFNPNKNQEVLKNTDDNIYSNLENYNFNKNNEYINNYKNESLFLSYEEKELIKKAKLNLMENEIQIEDYDK